MNRVGTSVVYAHVCECGCAWTECSTICSIWPALCVHNATNNACLRWLRQMLCLELNYGLPAHWYHTNAQSFSMFRTISALLDYCRMLSGQIFIGALSLQYHPRDVSSCWQQLAVALHFNTTGHCFVLNWLAQLRVQYAYLFSSSTFWSVIIKGAAVLHWRLLEQNMKGWKDWTSFCPWGFLRFRANWAGWLLPREWQKQACWPTSLFETPNKRHHSYPRYQRFEESFLVDWAWLAQHYPCPIFYNG